MIDFPIETLSEIFERHFVFGSVWFYRGFYFCNTGETRNKYIIVLNPKADDDQTYFIFPTSQIDKIKNNSKLIKDSFVISRGCCDIFPVDTIIVVSNIHTMPFDDMRNSYISRPFPQRIEYKGTLDNTIMTQLHILAKSSKRISPKTLKLIFNSN